MHKSVVTYLPFDVLSVKENKCHYKLKLLAIQYSKLLFLSFLLINIIMIHSVTANARSRRHPIETPIAIPMLDESSESVVKYLHLIHITIHAKQNSFNSKTIHFIFVHICIETSKSFSYTYMVFFKFIKGKFTYEGLLNFLSCLISRYCY